jgi:hypothetical protein
MHLIIHTPETALNVHDVSQAQANRLITELSDRDLPVRISVYPDTADEHREAAVRELVGEHYGSARVVKVSVER